MARKSVWLLVFLIFSGMFLWVGASCVPSSQSRGLQDSIQINNILSTAVRGRWSQEVLARELSPRLRQDGVPHQNETRAGSFDVTFGGLQIEYGFGFKSIGYVVATFDSAEKRLICAQFRWVPVGYP